jgi:hypothetical protein
MMPGKFQKLLAALGFSQTSAALFFSIDARTMRRWLAGELPIPASAAMLAAIMVERELSPWQVRLAANLPSIDGDLLDRPPGRPAKDRQSQAPGRRGKRQEKPGRGHKGNQAHSAGR